MTESANNPMQIYIDEASTGALSMSFSDTVYVNAEEFVHIDRDCDAMKTKIRELQRIAEDIAGREVWGLGEHPGSWIRTGPTLVERFREKAMGAADGNSVHEVLEKHYEMVDGIQQLHKAIAQRYVETDSEFASTYHELMESAPRGFQSEN